VEVSRIGAAVEFKADTPQKSPNDIEKAEFVTVLASVIAVGLANRGPGSRGQLSPRGL